MTEEVFRITRTQLDTVASLLAGHGDSHLAVVECGAGRATWPSGTERKSWSAYKIRETAIPADELTTIAVDTQLCLFSLDTSLLERVAFPHKRVLWGVLTDTGLQVYTYLDGRLSPIDVCSIIDHNLYFRFQGIDPMADTNNTNSELFERTTQAFGKGTTHYLSQLTVGVAGVSGTGSIIAEQLMRLGVKRLVLVDDDAVEVRNLGRILNSTKADADGQVNKAIMMQKVYAAIGLGTEVVAAPTVILDPETVHYLSQCDVLFGCLDSVDGRMHLNQISTFYSIPYIDLGVSLKALTGKIEEINGAIRFIMPGGSSLLSRHAYTVEQLASEALRREDPVAYRSRLAEKYIEGAKESSPAVICVNMQIASLAMMEFLNRIHPFMDTSNSEVETIYVNLVDLYFPAPTPPSEPDKALEKSLGKGDCTPMLNLPIMGTAK